MAKDSQDAAAESAEDRELALAATPQGRAELDAMPDPHIGAVHTPMVDVVYGEDVQGFYHGKPIEPGQTYRMTIGEATAVMTAGHGLIEGTEPEEDRAKRIAAHERLLAKEAEGE